MKKCEVQRGEKDNYILLPKDYLLQPFIEWCDRHVISCNSSELIYCPKPWRKKCVCMYSYITVELGWLCGHSSRKFALPKWFWLLLGAPDHFPAQGSLLQWFTYKCGKQNPYWFFRWRLSILKKVQFIKTTLNFQENGKRARQKKRGSTVFCFLMANLYFRFSLLPMKEEQSYISLLYMYTIYIYI